MRRLPRPAMAVPQVPEEAVTVRDWAVRFDKGFGRPVRFDRGARFLKRRTVKAEDAKSQRLPDFQRRKLSLSLSLSLVHVQRDTIRAQSCASLDL
jgi:hypothetical protein